MEAGNLPIPDPALKFTRSSEGELLPSRLADRLPHTKKGPAEAGPFPSGEAFDQSTVICSIIPWATCGAPSRASGMKQSRAYSPACRSTVI
jgi:hypothetical protein